MKRKSVFTSMGVATLALGVCLSGSPTFAQDQQQAPPDQSPTVQEQYPAPNPAPNPAAAPAPQPQGAPPAEQPALPATLTLREGTVIPVRVIQRLSSNQNQVGERFTASLDQPLVANGWVVARRGQLVTGRIVVADKGGHGESSKLGVQLIELTLVDGRIVPVNTQFTESLAPRGRDTSRTVSTMATTTVLGTIVGAAVGGGTGAAIGAGLGATAGAATVLSTKGSPTVINPEQLLTFRLETPVRISTEQGEVAFQPVKQSDYARSPDQDAYAQPRLGRRPYYYAGPGYYGPYPDPYWFGWGYYPVMPYAGFYGYYGGFYGPRYYGRGLRGFRR